MFTHKYSFFTHCSPEHAYSPALPSVSCREWTGMNPVFFPDCGAWKLSISPDRVSSKGAGRNEDDSLASF